MIPSPNHRRLLDQASRRRKQNTAIIQLLREHGMLGRFDALVRTRDPEVLSRLIAAVGRTPPPRPPRPPRRPLRQ